MAQKFAWQKGAERVIAVDHLSYCFNHSKIKNRTEVFNFTKHKDMGEVLKETTKGGQMS